MRDATSLKLRTEGLAYSHNFHPSAARALHTSDKKENTQPSKQTLSLGKNDASTQEIFAKKQSTLPFNLSKSIEL